MKYFLTICLFALSVPVSAQTVSAIVSARVSPGTSNEASVPVAAEFVSGFDRRVSVTARAQYSSEQKTYRTEGRGNAFSGQVDGRVVILKSFFLSGGFSAGRVSYPHDPLEAAYTKNSFIWRTGAGIHDELPRGWYSFHYSYLWPDRATFDDGAGGRISNETRGHEFGSDSCVQIQGSLCLGHHVQIRRLRFVDPNHPEHGTLRATQSTVGLRIGWRR